MNKLSAPDQEQIANTKKLVLKEAEKAFRKIDINADGDLDREELRVLASGFADCDEEAREKQIQEFLNVFDADGDGKIQMREFINCVGKLFD